MCRLNRAASAIAISVGAVLLLVGCAPPAKEVPLYVEVRGPMDATVMVPGCSGDELHSVGIAKTVDQQIRHFGYVKVGETRVLPFVLDAAHIQGGSLSGEFDVRVLEPFPTGDLEFVDLGGFDFSTDQFDADFGLSKLEGLAPGTYRVEQHGDDEATIAPAAYDEARFLTEACGDS